MYDMLNFIPVKEIGVIKSIEGQIATVSLLKKSTCEGCTMGVCKPDEQSMEIKALNPVNACVGQKVTVVMKPFSYLKGSVIIYGIPAIALVTGAVIGRKIIGNYFPHLEPDIVSAISGVGAFVISFIIIKFWSTRLEKKELEPVVEEILND
ncbi:MAG: SoxR reducing system RseC family protein [Nitrospirota bacterium]